MQLVTHALLWSNGQIKSIVLKHVLAEDDNIHYKVRYDSAGSAGEAGHLIIDVYDGKISEDVGDSSAAYIDSFILSEIGGDDFDRAVQQGFNIVDIYTKVSLDIKPNEVQNLPSGFEAFEQSRQALA